MGRPWEWVTGVLILSIAAAYATPRLLRARHKLLREEVPLIVHELLLQSIAHKAEHGAHPLFEPSPVPIGQVTSALHDWQPIPLPGYQPSKNPVRGTYKVSLQGGGLVVEGWCDVDGDGRLAHYRATPSQAVTRVTEPEVY